jgi:LCP family protein required for cell wall assembly
MNKSKPPLHASSLILIMSGFLLFIAVTIFIGYLAYSKAYHFFLSYNLTDLGGPAIVSAQPTTTPDASGTPAPTPLSTAQSGPIVEPWDKASRVSILVMGLDYRDWEAGEGPPRTDTMILLSIDPVTMSAGMLNIPRDLWVAIPGGFGYSKINTAYPIGEANQWPGGGPGMAMDAVEALLGIPIDYYAQIDFNVFEDFIDELGGINILPPEEITVDPIGPGNTVVLKNKPYRLDGPTALAYARARSTEGVDFDRADRQQQVILAIRDRIMDIGIPTLLAKAPQLYEDLSAGIHTNLSLEDALQLGMLALQIPVEEYKRGSIAPPEAVTFGKSPDGTQDILKPVPDRIRQLRDEIFASSSFASPIAEGKDNTELMQLEDARLLVLNGTYAGGLAGNTENYLKGEGANVVGTGDGEKVTYTKVIDYTGNPYTLRYLVDLMNITPYSIVSEYNPSSDVDVIVVLGDDWAGNNPLP